MADLIVRRFKTNEEVSRVKVSHPFSSIRGQEKYEIIMMGMLRNMNTDEFFIDDTEIDKEREKE